MWLWRDWLGHGWWLPWCCRAQLNPAKSLSTLFLVLPPERARDYLHKTGRFIVIGGIVSPVHDSYGKTVGCPLSSLCLLCEVVSLKFGLSTGQHCLTCAPFMALFCQGQLLALGKSQRERRG